MLPVYKLGGYGDGTPGTTWDVWGFLRSTMFYLRERDEHEMIREMEIGRDKQEIKRERVKIGRPTKRGEKRGRDPKGRERVARD